MMRPMGYSKGKSVMAKGCKLGRKNLLKCTKVQCPLKVYLR
ncbi:MAG: hypothetical protein CM15mV124_070 [uncultured marine virus]|nr:MAG: hypothetical protein CM15mV124_070 [uncultured marine virus]